MVDPTTLAISIDRTSMTLGPLLLAGHDDPARVLSISSYREPAMQPRITSAPDGDVHGNEPLGWSYQETVLAFTVFAEDAAAEADARAAIAELTAALARLRYEVTVTVVDATPEVWICRPGAVAPVDDRSFTDLQDHDNAWAVAIPAYPIRSM